MQRGETFGRRCQKVGKTDPTDGAVGSGGGLIGQRCVAECGVGRSDTPAMAIVRDVLQPLDCDRRGLRSKDAEGVSARMCGFAHRRK